MLRPAPRSTLFPYTTLFRSASTWVHRCRATSSHPVRQGAHARATASFGRGDRKSTRLNSSHITISYAVFCLKKKIQEFRDDAQINETRKRTQIPSRPGRDIH